jgi:hypothetical protein
LSSTACVWPEIRRDDIVVSFRLSVIGFIARRNYTTPKSKTGTVRRLLAIFYLLDQIDDCVDQLNNQATEEYSER